MARLQMELELNKIYQGDCLEVLKTFPDESVDCVVTSPPYYALRDYGVSGQLGIEPTYQEYINKLLAIFDEVKRVLKPEGTCWVNLGDSYGGSCGSGNNMQLGESEKSFKNKYQNKNIRLTQKISPKSLLQIPSRFAIGMTDRGWILRNELIWHKKNCMPQSVKDRFTVDFEKIFFFVKNKKYWFEQQFEDALGYDGRNDIEYKGGNKDVSIGKHSRWRKYINTDFGGNGTGFQNHSGYSNLKNPYRRNKRSVWKISTRPYKESHFATFPESLIVTPIKAGCPENGIVLDPFMGAGTVAVVALKLNKNYIGIELNPEYIELAEKRIEPYKQQTKLFA